MTLKELTAARKARAEQMRALLAAATDGILSAEQQAQFDKLEAECAALGKSIEAAERLEALEASTGRRSDPTQTPRVEGGVDRRTLDPWAGFSGAGDFYRAVRGVEFGNRDQRLDALRSAAGATEHGENSQDGYLAPPQLSADLLTAQEEMDPYEDLTALCDIEPTSAPYVEFDRDEYLVHSSGEIVARRRDEGDTLTKDKILPTQKASLKAEALYVYVAATDELLADAPRLYNRLTTKSAAAIVHKQNTELMEGTGVGQMLGVLNSGNRALISIAKESGQAADTVVKLNLDKMYNAISPRAKRRGIWMCGAGVATAIESIYQANTNLFVPAGGLTETPLARLRGRPLVETEYLPELGDENDLIFVDLLAYKIILRQNTELAQSMHILFDRSMMAFRWTKRINGMPRLSSSITRNKASNYPVSPFVRLEARA